MSKIIIVKNKNDCGFKLILPNPKIYGEEDGKLPFFEEKALKKFISEGHEWFITDYSNLPEKGESRKQWYLDNQIIKLDANWDVRLMPENFIKKRHLKKIEKKLDDELEKESPDLVKIHKLQRQKEKCQNFSEKDWHEQALQNLDERVNNGEPDKPIIRQKLQAKIAELGD